MGQATMGRAATGRARMRSRARAMALKGPLMLAAVFAVICVAQEPTLGTGQVGTQGGSHQSGNLPASAGNPSLGPPGALDSMTSPFPDNSRQKRNDERQRRLVADTQKLLALTSQLKAEVASTGAEAMSPEMLKQTEEIEKLAKSVKDKMRD